MLFKKILVPIDFSDGAEAAVAAAIDLGRKTGDAVTLLHVYELPILPHGMSPAATQDLYDRILAAIADRLDEARERAARAAEGAVAIDTRSVDGPAAEQIVAIARDDGYGIVVMGTHGRTGLAHLWIGSVAERVVRTSTVPVMTVRLPEGAQ
jgi:nucleotide-binding universal stress UspA family protein